MPRPPRPLVLYQDSCRFCRGAARFLAWIDRHERLAMLGFSDPAAEPFVAAIPDAELAASWQLIQPSGERLTEGGAALAALEAVPATAWLGRILRILRLRRVLDVLYRVVARTRGLSGRFVSDRPGPRRWD